MIMTNLLINIDPLHYTIRIAAYSPELVTFCRSLQGARYNPHGKFWQAPRNVPNAIDLRREGYCIDNEMLASSALALRDPALPPEFNWDVSAKFYKHQDAWEAWCKTRTKCLLAAEMGLGKTLMALQWLAAMGVNPNEVLIVCPISLIQHWVEEIKKFAGRESVAVTGSTECRLDLLAMPGIHIVNYEFISLNKVALSAVQNKKVLILDESHKIKDPRSVRSKTMKVLAEGASHCLLLTGTPVSQGAQDYYAQVRCLNSRLLGTSFTSFRHRYCLEEQVRGAPAGVRRITGYKNLDELVSLINPYVYSIKKKDCINLPEKVYMTRYVTLSKEQSKVYNEMKYEMIATMKSGEVVEGQNILTRLLRFSQITQGFLQKDDEVQVFENNPKLACLLELLEEIGDEPVIIMCRFIYDMTVVCKALADKKISHNIICGDVKADKRHEVVNRFRHGDFRVLVGQLRVAGIGFNMEHCKHMIFYSNEYSLVDREQAEDRIHRATSVGGSCVYIDIVAQGTIDEHVISALRSKKDFATQIYHLQKQCVDYI